MPITLYGIAHCDTVKKARAWLAEHGVAYVFHDFKTQGLPDGAPECWAQAVGWEKLLNRRGSTWRRLDDAARAGARDAASACALMRAQPSLIKRPVVQWRDALTVGFDAADWAARTAQGSAV
ncbi:Spx/MgsR family RNA polymerase-binding regulatory protein [Comamonas sp. NLF-1-9]|uniref:Spx/MgsR family RNA polymerase-binding regulatory protein n=1 Tax=Comamonas sp. NLF-1-9 TaxID=2853163 RepID=UPI001C44EF85|nr:Spx/MgsR family RNA polymerase-binding regulatory protein [Comamonas sp. NLF-1-9]QXL84931.1 Spx/MgsR family RNA polymerase-binding regulatory protein [Comamonas sp. NLF-1-9]